MGNPLKKTMVYLGLADEEETYDEVPAAHATRQEHEPTRREEIRREREEVKAAPVTPLRRPTAVRQPSAGAVNEILTVHPKQYRDAQVIAESFRDGIPVIINLSQMSDADASADRLRERPLPRPLRPHRARDRQGLPAVAEHRGVGAGRDRRGRRTRARALLTRDGRVRGLDDRSDPQHPASALSADAVRPRDPGMDRSSTDRGVRAARN